MRDLAVADVLTVDPHVEGGIHPLKGEEDLQIPPGVGQRENAPVEPHGIHLRHARRVHRIRVGDIGVVRRAVPEHLPVARYRNTVPLITGIVGLGEALRHLVRRCAIVKRPTAVQQAEAVRGRPLARQRGGGVLTGQQRGMRRLAVDLQQVGIFPVVHGCSFNTGVAVLPLFARAPPNTCHPRVVIELFDNADTSAKEHRKTAPSSWNNPCVIAFPRRAHSTGPHEGEPYD
ncbi:MAG: hypothetical protein BWY76_03049 [bacterium ADurb.Bin429]|nr:MAG: hypothetical protein BWY76_03049 [bacterium ADurb.Bin429]